jgi:hypothetical protein
MNNQANIRVKGFRRHYEKWLIGHPGAIPYDKVIQYVIHGDEFGRKLPNKFFASLCKTTENTFLKWLPIIKEELAKEGIQAK